ncbi:Tripartite-type tricarboxylate transporter, receptor component TctC [Polaromonas sp. OV174]|uniref:Bug family tripartite tricarboxylate transporter substrate binding protein n=1 Tax=Polaromonas sp. OV174 TaxID=1855300 RepID=UPI0008E7E56A|nr:tripartite tricarboxylate transporter substrate-binding protein [Polaromonas sp. OV174]SFC67218.1 Tripartite-type tricarboxylate transporter, receptor component TctC [Polaromonas sp. OV174]
MTDQTTIRNTKQTTRRQTLQGLGALAFGSTLLSTPLALLAQPSDKVVRFILPVGAGSGVDTIVRAASLALGKALGHPVVIENQPGAGGIVGTSTLVKSAPDGMTLSVVSNNHVIYPSVYKSLPFDPIADITPITIIGTTPMVLVVNPAKLPVSNVRELVALLKAKPDAYNYASSGNGTILHLAAQMFLDEAQVKAKHIPYKGVGPMVADLIGGQVDIGVLALPSIQAHLKSGALRAIGVGGNARTAAAPDIPTIAEQGLPNYNLEGWFAVIGPAKLPPAEVKRIHAAVVAAYAAPEVKDAMLKQGNTINPSSPEFAAQYFRTELAKYAQLVKKGGVEVQ